MALLRLKKLRVGQGKNEETKNFWTDSHLVLIHTETSHKNNNRGHWFFF